MAAQCAVAAGDLPSRATARRTSARPAVLPRGGPPGDLAADRGRGAGGCLGRGGRPGRAVPRGLGAGRTPARRQPQPRAYAAATVHALRGDDDARAAWMDIVDALATPGRPLSRRPLRRVLRRPGAAPPGPAEQAVPLLDTPPEEFRPLTTACGGRGTPRCGPRPPSLAGLPDAADRIRRARLADRRTTRSPRPSWTAPRPCSSRRAADGRDGLAAAAAALHAPAAATSGPAPW